MSNAQIRLIRQCIERARLEGDERAVREYEQEIEEIERDMERREQFEREVEERRELGDW